tara:strand:+ start:1334 stop:2173 length:840 start_codon:yes stop_codon:yes gene_type:complete
MRFTKRKTEEVVVSIIGEEGLKIVEELNDKENVSEFDLAKKIKEDIKVVRKMLYMLYNHNLVGFTRKKDKQKGWYIYYWTLLPENIKFNYFKRRREQLSHLQRRLDEENKELFFVCPNKCVRLNFDQSMDFEFHCPECGKLITQDDNKDEIKNINNEIASINDELKKLKQHRIVRRKIISTKKKIVKNKKAEKKRAKPKKPVKKVKSKPKKKPVKKAIKKKAKAIKKKVIKKKKVEKRKNKPRTKPIKKAVKKLKSKLKPKKKPVKKAKKKKAKKDVYF